MIDLSHYSLPDFIERMRYVTQAAIDLKIINEEPVPAYLLTMHMMTDEEIAERWHQKHKELNG